MKAHSASNATTTLIQYNRIKPENLQFSPIKTQNILKQ